MNKYRIYSLNKDNANLSFNKSISYLIRPEYISFNSIYYKSIMKPHQFIPLLLLLVSVFALPKQIPIIGIYTQSDASD